MTTPEEQAAIELTQQVQEATARFFQQMQARHEMGEKKYGPIKFMQVNTLTEAMDEVVDLANYAMYTYMKLYVLNSEMQANLTLEDTAPLGPNSFQGGIPHQREGS